jgi:hypothetical protein
LQTELWRASAIDRMPDAVDVNRVRFVGDACADCRVHIDLSALRPA